MMQIERSWENPLMSKIILRRACMHASGSTLGGPKSSKSTEASSTGAFFVAESGDIVGVCWRVQVSKFARRF